MFKFIIIKIHEILKLSPSRWILLTQQFLDSLPDKEIKLWSPVKQELDSRLKARKNEKIEYFIHEKLKIKLAGEQ